MQEQYSGYVDFWYALDNSKDLMNTIRVQLQGGLGNQLFIWAMAHEILFKTGKSVRLEFVNDRHQRNDRPVEIARLLQFCEHEISINQTKSIGIFFRVIDKIGYFSKDVKVHLNRFMGIYDCNTSYEIPELSERLPRIIRGYFQSAEMVDRNYLILERELKSGLELEQPIHGVESGVVLHIRRGDTREISKIWGVLSVSYYLKQVDVSKDLIINIDDKQEVELLKQQFPKATVLTPDDSTTWQTLKILAEAETLIIANSTLSWWGAWIKSKTNPETVYFPDSWRPADHQTFEELRIESARIVASEFEV